MYEENYINWQAYNTFKEIYPTYEQFKAYVDSITEDPYLFDLSIVYGTMLLNYEFDKIRYSSRSGFNSDFVKIWNGNIYIWNRVHTLLSVDYSEEVGQQTVIEEVTKDVVNDIIDSSNSGTAEQDTFDKPQFNVVAENPTSKIAGSNTDAQNREQDRVQDINRDTTTKNSLINKNEQIEQYLTKYRRFSYTELVSNFEKLFLNLL